MRVKTHITWISVKEKLPDQGEYVLAYGECEGYVLANINPSCIGGKAWIGEEREFIDNLNGEIITHWIPLPEKPK